MEFESSLSSQGLETGSKTLPELTPHLPGPDSEPTYLFLPNRKGTATRSWIGILGYTFEGEAKTFVWLLNNNDQEDLLKKTSHRIKMATTIAQIKLEGVDAIIGPGIDFKNSHKDIGVALESNTTALYIDVDRRWDFSVDSIKYVRKKWKQIPIENRGLINTALTMIPIIR